MMDIFECSNLLFVSSTLNLSSLSIFDDHKRYYTNCSEWDELKSFICIVILKRNWTLPGRSNVHCEPTIHTFAYSHTDRERTGRIFSGEVLPKNVSERQYIPLLYPF